MFGATGPTGRHIIKEALKRGYTLSVYTRDAKKLASFAGRVEIVVGDLQDRSAIAKCIQCTDAVISTLGPNSLKVQGDKPVMHGLTHIIAAMKHAGVCRLIQISTAAYRDPKDGLEQALYARRPAEDAQWIHHSDRGSQGRFNRSSEHLILGGVSWVEQRIGCKHSRGAELSTRPERRRIGERLSASSGRRLPPASQARRLLLRSACRKP
nr:NAD(P)H-binding protein [Robbsia andropogonis]